MVPVPPQHLHGVEVCYCLYMKTKSQIGKMSKNKGKVGEREVVHLLREYGYEARRGQQFKGGKDSPDVISNLLATHIEVKRTEGLSIYPALSQAKSDAAENETPVVFHRRSGKKWLVIMEATDFLDIVDSLMMDNV